MPFFALLKTTHKRKKVARSSSARRVKVLKKHAREVHRVFRCPKYVVFCVLK